MTSRWRFTNCFIPLSPQSDVLITSSKNHKLFIKFIVFPDETGYEAQLTDFHGHIWRESLRGQELQDRLKSEVSGLEIETSDILKLLDQLCQNFIESSCETSADLASLTLRASVKIGFIKLKWTFKAELSEGFEEMVRSDFLLPLFANLREDKVIKEEVDEVDLDKFYENVVPNLKTIINPMIIPVDSVEISVKDELSSVDPNPTITPIEQTTVEEPVDLEEIKRKALDEQLQSSKKKKKKLI